MKKLLLFLIVGILFANDYKSYKIVEMINEMSQKKVNFLSIPEYNIFPVNIDNKTKIQQYIQEQTASIDLRAIAEKRAFINNKWYKEGDKMQNLIISKITNNCVSFISENINKNFDICLSFNLIKVSK